MTASKESSDRRPKGWCSPWGLPLGGWGRDSSESRPSGIVTALISGTRPLDLRDRHFFPQLPHVSPLTLRDRHFFPQLPHVSPLDLRDRHFFPQLPHVRPLDLRDRHFFPQLPHVMPLDLRDSSFFPQLPHVRKIDFLAPPPHLCGSRAKNLHFRRKSRVLT